LWGGSNQSKPTAKILLSSDHQFLFVILEVSFVQEVKEVVPSFDELQRFQNAPQGEDGASRRNDLPSECWLKQREDLSCTIIKASIFDKLQPLGIINGSSGRRDLPHKC
jgi:hypothetical protein